MRYLLIFIVSFFSLLIYGQKNNVETQDFEKEVDEKESAYRNSYKGKGSGYKQFKRWEDFIQNRLDENGNIVNNSAMSYNALESLKKSGKITNNRTNGYWTELGPDTWVNDKNASASIGGWNPGNGRINEIAFPFSGTSVFYVGAATGGLWKTTNNANSWFPLTDGLPNIGISGIAISHTNPDHIYIQTGDGDSGVLYSIGVLKSEDGGGSWFKTALEFGPSQRNRAFELKMNPNNSQEIIAATSSGLYKTDDGGVTWPKKSTAYYYDIEYNPSNTDIVYASTGDSIMKSIDGGDNWNKVLDLSAITYKKCRIEIAVTIANSDKVYAILGDSAAYRGIWVSSNRGVNWTRHYNNNDPNIIGNSLLGDDVKSQSNYDLAIAVSPNDDDQIYVGGINIWRSDDGGDNWTRVTYWVDQDPYTEYVHGDIHELIFRGSELFTGTDGGIFSSTTTGSTWNDLSSGLRIMQPHKIGISNTNTSLVLLGTQDNGTNKYTGTYTVEHVRGADGFECIISSSDNNHIFTSSQYGAVEKSTDGGTSFVSLIPKDQSTKIFNNSLILRPILENSLIQPRGNKIDYYDLNGSFIDSVAIQHDSPKTVKFIHMSKTNNKMLVAGIFGSTGDGSSDSVWMTTDFFAANPIWTNITSNLPSERNVIRNAAIDPSNNNHIVVVFSSYYNGLKVFETWNKGGIWNNISHDLENIPVNCAVFDPEVDNSFYIGTDIGVFYLNSGSMNWTYYSNGLPPVIITELELNTNNNLLYAGTYGRGIWRSPIYSDCPTSYSLTPENDPNNPDYTGRQYYEASIGIISTREIKGGLGTDVHYQAGIYVDLKPGFEVTGGNMFRTVSALCGEIVLSVNKEENINSETKDINQ